MAKASRVAAKTASTLQELSEQATALAERVEELYALVSQQPKKGDLEPSFLKAKQAAADAKSEKEG